MTDPAQVINDIKQRVLRGEKVPREEMRAALEASRKNHEAAAQATVSRKKQPDRTAEELIELLDKPA